MIKSSSVALKLKLSPDWSNLSWARFFFCNSVTHLLLDKIRAHPNTL